MCGIVYAKNTKDTSPINQTIKALYLSQRERGYEGFGFVGMTKSELLYHRAETEQEIFKTLSNPRNYFDEILFHHRYPTSTKNTTNTAHPFEITYNDKTYYFVHNGIISNAKELKKDHQQLNINYSSYNKIDKTFNDSEALAYSFVLQLNNIKTNTAPAGSASILCLETDNKTNKATRLYFYTNGGNPLKIHQDNELFIISSETGTNDVAPKTLFYYDYQSKTIVKYKKNNWQVNQYTFYDDYIAYTNYPKSLYPKKKHTNIEANIFSVDELFDKRDQILEQLEKTEQQYNKECLLELNPKRIAHLEREIDNLTFQLDEVENAITY